MDAKTLAEAYFACTQNPEDDSLKQTLDTLLELGSRTLVNEHDEFVVQGKLMPGIIQLKEIEKVTTALFEPELAKKVTGSVITLLVNKGYILATSAG